MQKTRDELEQERRHAGQPGEPEELEYHFEAPGGVEIDPEDLRPRPWSFPDPKRVLWSVAIVLTVVAAAVLPPLIGANRFRRRIAQSVSESLGRPVHMREVNLTMLPAPGFTLTDFEVADDPAFGAEPVIQAREVRVTLRVWSLWRRRLEFSRISLTDPSVNLVHRADGRWNIESILLQASRIEAAPTAQSGAGPAPRFPYIEATGARVNVKMGLEKMPLALTEADLALWLPEPSQWRLRLEGHPTRTDAAATDTGTLRVEGTLGKAARIEEVPVNLTAEWRNAPLGGVSQVLLGTDAGFRGEMTLETRIRGTAGESAVESRLELSDLRRADFVPRHTLEVTATCRAQAGRMFHEYSGLQCGSPAKVLEDAQAGGVTVSSKLLQLNSPSMDVDAKLHEVPAGGLLDALRLGSTRVSPDLSLSGAMSGELECCATDQPPVQAWRRASGQVSIPLAKLALGSGKPYLDGPVRAVAGGGEVVVGPMALELGGAQPAQLEVRVDPQGFAMHLDGTVLRSRLLELAAALPQFGDGLAAALPAAGAAGANAPLRLDLASSRTWSGQQTWTPAAAKAPKSKRTRRR
jgi:AsmA protein